MLKIIKTWVKGIEEERLYLREISKEFQKEKELFEKTRELIDANAVRIRETSEQMKRTDEQMKRTDEQMKRTDEQMKRTDEQMKRTDERMERTDERMEKIGLQLGGLGNNVGGASEEFFFRCLENKPELGGMHFNKVIRNIWEGSQEHEYDILLINGDSVALIEVKHKAHPDRVKHIVQYKTERFRNYFAIFKAHKLYIGLASMSTNADLISAAREAGIFLLTQKGDVLEVANTAVKMF